MNYKYSKKKKGSLLIEVIVGLMILMIASTMAMTSIFAANKSKIRRDRYDEANRIAYSIMNEIKYNYTYKEVCDEILKIGENGVENKSLGIKYKNDTLEKLPTTKIFLLERGTDIIIQILSKNATDNILQMKITINLNVGGELIIVERIFNKSWWMDS